MLSAFCALVEAGYSATIEKADNIPHAAIFLCTVFFLDPIFVLSALAFSARAKSSKNIFFFVPSGVSSRSARLSLRPMRRFFAPFAVKSFPQRSLRTF
jgi:hypothetical protein